MREIKFRIRLNKASGDKSKVFIYVKLHEFNFGQVLKLHPDATIDEGTGLNDENGVEIYEGDILKHTYRAGHTLYIVKFGSYDNGEEYEGHQSGHGVYLEEIYEICNSIEERNLSQHSVFGWPHVTDLEIVGNVHENPELLNLTREV